MRYEFFKIMDPQYVQAFLDGTLYMNTLNYFRKLEGNKAQQDPLEGVCGTIRKDQLRQFGFHFDPEFLQAIKGHVPLISDNYGIHNVFCLYRLPIDDQAKTILRPSTQLVDFQDGEVAEKVVVRIKDPDAFLTRLNEALHSALAEHSLEYGIYGGMEYTNAWTSADGPGTRSVFHKDPSYAYQREWRLCLLRYGWEDIPYLFQIGDLRDICQTLPLDRFLHDTESLFPGYTPLDTPPAPTQEQYQIVGNINPVSRLMYTYMPHPPEKPTRSDQAEADWHYTRFLELSDRQDEIDPYLSSQLEEYMDVDHVELLANYRCSKDLWVQATDAFDLLLKRAPERINDDPGRFFFLFHTILMQHQQPADAAKLLRIAENRYALPEDLKTVMYSDCFFALGFYDKVLPLFEQMCRSSHDPILEYDLAVAELHLLHFESAQAHIRRFRQFFSCSPAFVRKAAQFQTLTDCFCGGPPLPETGQPHPFTELGWTQELESVLTRAVTEKREVGLGIDTLYQLEVAGKWDLLSPISTVEVATLTVARIIELYRQTGVSIFRQIIMHIAQLPNLSLCSPSLDFYLVADIEYPDLPPHYKMERALLAERIAADKAAQAGK